jgi:hypothetical protein
MRFMRLLLPLAAGVKIYKYAAALDPDRIGRDAILFETGFANSAAAVEFPVVPRADDVIAVQATFAKRTADMIARV